MWYVALACGLWHRLLVRRGQASSTQHPGPSAQQERTNKEDIIELVALLLMEEVLSQPGMEGIQCQELLSLVQGATERLRERERE